MKKVFALGLCVSVLSVAGCTSVATKDDVYILKSTTNEEFAALRIEIQRLQEQVQELSQTVDLVEKDTTNQMLTLSTEVYDRVASVENKVVQEQEVSTKKMQVLLDEVSRVEQRALVTNQSQSTNNQTSYIPENATTYLVRTGDTLSKIAVKFGITKDELILANEIENENYLAIGDVLVIPE